MDTLPGWETVSAAILSCPGPLRRHTASLVPLGELALPQVLLGSESQLLAFAAAASGLSGRLFFAPMPEMFPGRPSVRAALAGAGGAARGGGLARPVHLRFGSVRAARVLKGVRNACVVAEAGGAAPLTASHHPFASGMVLPAAIRRLFVYGPSERPRVIGGQAIPASLLPASCVTADIPADMATRRSHRQGADAGLDLISLSEFRSLAWAAGPVRARMGRLMAGVGYAPVVLLPWNMDHPGSIVPALLARLARLHAPDGAAGAALVPRIVLLPFNYVGQTGIIRQLISSVREAAHTPDGALANIFLARTGTMDAVALLRSLATCAWVDGNDPEHWWTLARLQACGVETILIDPSHAAAPGVRLHADEAVWVEAETRCGTLTFPAWLPSLRALPDLLRMTARRPAAPAPRPRSRRPARLRAEATA